jgi:TonB-dependent SusC/RagA subfamily outer membrane receptor
MSLDEVVVVAYGTQKKTNITGAIVTVSGGQVADKPFTSVDKALQGNVAGLQSSSSSGAPGSSTDIRIRGVGSINASAAPLWVIDGVIATTSDLTINTTTANPLSTINPDDIESISVLKDAISTSPYGSRGANGVILVTTKRAKPVRQGSI